MSRISFQQLVSYSFILLLLCIDYVYAQSQSGENDFREAGYPTMFIIGGVILVIIAIATGGGGLSVAGIQSGCSQLFQHILLFILNTLLLIFGIFLLFGPGGTQRVNILGFQLMVFVALAYYAGLSSSQNGRYLLLGFGTFTWLGLIGALNFLNYSTSIWELQNPNCLAYFGKGADPNYGRCKDDGYLQLLRTTGSASILLLLFVLAVVFFNDSPSVAPSKKNDNFRAQSTAPPPPPHYQGEQVA